MASGHDSNARDVQEWQYHVVPGQDDGWEVVIDEGRGVIRATYCSDWHRVERVCAALEQRRLQAPEERRETPSP